MKRALLFIFLISAVGLNANYNHWNISGEVRCANVVSEEMEIDLMADNEGIIGNNLSEPVNHYYPNQQIKSNIECGNPPSHYTPCWADDILIWDNWNLGNAPVAFDYDEDGFLYIAAITKTSYQDDSVIFLKSTDNGYTWNQFWLLHSSQNIEMWDFDMRVGHVGSDPHVYVVLFDSNYTDGQREMWFFDYNQATSITSMDFFDPDTHSQFESPFHVAMDITDEATPKIWITYNRYYSSTAAWNSVYSTDGGSTWNIITHSISDGCSYSDVCMGPDDYVYIVNIYTESSNRVRMNERQFTIYGSYYDVSPTAAEDRYYPSVASEMGAAYGSNVVHVLYQTGSGTTGRIKNSYTTDGGTNWTIDEFWSPIGDVQATRPYVRCGWETDQFISIATRTDWDSLATAWSVDESWGAVTYVNDHRPTGEITSQGIVRTSTGRQLIYREWGSDNLWYDRFDMANSVEEITQGSGQVMNITNNGSQVDIRFSLNQPQPVSINLVDVSGRTVRNLLNQNLSSGDHNLSYDLSGLNGSYIVNFRAGSQTSSEKIFLF
ncbi:MAG: T9SS type A sorting domain-containing protein [bacterium]